MTTSEGELASFRSFGLRNPVAVIPNGIPHDWSQPRGDSARFRASLQVPERARILLFLSRIHHKKGLHLLLGKSGERLGDWHLVIVGPAEDERYKRVLVTYPKGQQIGSRVHFAGPRNGESKRDAFAAAKLPTLSDNFAIAIAEALGVGVPTITTTGAMAWRNIDSIGCGWCTEPNQDALAAAVVYATSLPRNELRQMGQLGRRFVNRHFRWETIAQQCGELYRWLLGTAKRPDFVSVNEKWISTFNTDAVYAPLNRG